jgi:excisionase family DNA binding protein
MATPAGVPIPLPMPSDKLSVVEAAEILGVSSRKVYTLAASLGGPIPCFKIGRRVIFERSAILDYLESCRCTQVEIQVDRPLISTIVIRPKISGVESNLERVCRKLGVNPRPIHGEYRKNRRK